MTHLLPPHADLNLGHSSLQSALQIDPNQQPPPTAQQQQQAQQQSPPTPVSQSTSRKRRKANENGDEAPHPAEPRRLRRSHEACARCRSKKIKASPCDSKHPRCTACATAGTPCQQEDRHRQTLTPRGHTERLERQLLQCEALLKRHYPLFDLNDLDNILAREGIELDTGDNGAPSTFQFAPNSPQSGPSRGYPLRTEGSPTRGYPYPVPPPPAPGQPMMPAGYHGPMPMHYPPYPPPPHMMQGPLPPGYDPRIPPFQHPLGPHPGGPQRPPSPHEIRGQDPHSHDMSNTQALAKTFGVATAIMNDVNIPPLDKEDLAVGSAALISGRDREMCEPSLPRDASKWITVSMRRNSVSGAPLNSSPVQTPAGSTVSVWLPKSRDNIVDILDAYFTRLNFHRPVLMRGDFESTLNKLYNGEAVPHDPGFVCSTYLVLALGTLSELNHRVAKLESAGQSAASAGPNMKNLMPLDWPEHEEFFQLALSVKPDLRVTVSSLQALILLHWYLYTERQGRTLWRLVGSLVRLAIELGLHHDPTSQDNVFSPEECQLRIRLWAIVLVHDRGTSIQLGRPLAIAPSDSNTPRPTRGKGSDISEHFVLSAPVAEIQADIINSLYAPTRQTADSIMRHANRIMRSMVVFRQQLPDHYKWFFGGTDEWSVEKRTKLVADITEDEGLTLLKIGMTKVLLLRALFSSKELEYAQRHRALVDAIVTSHNIIVVHNQLIRFPDIAFFVSPIPLHIAAMVILYGHMSRCDRIPRQIAMEDVWMALDMLPSFRFRWERKDLNGGHPLISKLAEKVLDVNLHQVAPTGPSWLLSEHDWEGEHTFSPKPSAKGQSGQSPMTPKVGPAQYGAPGPHGPMALKGSPGPHNGETNGGQPKMPDLPPYYFYPFYPDGTSGNGAQTSLAYPYQPSQDQYVLEEKDTTISPTVNTTMQMQQWSGVSAARPSPRAVSREAERECACC
ncbi:fungal-specific transcription factor domain-containing protein [Daedaleopsis nitida]|nr:fungal-specific transcription factor domain-containing protein [Daedaleopsis nitida]